MPTTTNSNMKCTGSTCTDKDLCPGWIDNTFCIGVTKDEGVIACRSCEPAKEMWVALDYNNWNGACICAPKPLDLIIDNHSFLGNLAVIGGFIGGCYMAFRCLCKGKKRGRR